MENKVPTITEFLNKLGTPESYRIVFEKEDNTINIVTIQKLLQEFTKLHVVAALEAAAKNSKILVDYPGGVIDSNMYFHDFGNHGGKRKITVSKDSILEAYPLENIK